MKQSASGFTLIELMIAMLIGLVVSAGAIQMFQHAMTQTNRANEIQRTQQTLLATIEHVIPRIRTASVVSPDPDDANGNGLQITRTASSTNPGNNCTGAPNTAGAVVVERYFISGQDLNCESNGQTAVVAFDIVSFNLNRLYEDTNGDGRGDTTHTKPLPNSGVMVGAEITIEQPLVDGGSRIIPMHIALRNNALANRNKRGDFSP
ncbi:PilW family protein [Marinobacter sp.]|uniref:PilW family protein n=1 Tax=Marinobacter sp. TaxID=50741 RepID=UPI002B26F1F9|nr:prepilin-type N-terminal cleavage/methylation domain-containing protein [Marinobacter sp.]